MLEVRSCVIIEGVMESLRDGGRGRPLSHWEMMESLRDGGRGRPLCHWECCSQWGLR